MELQNVLNFLKGELDYVGSSQIHNFSFQTHKTTKGHAPVSVIYISLST
jgi:hypothetical protein